MVMPPLKNEILELLSPLSVCITVILAQRAECKSIKLKFLENDDGL